MTDDQRLKLELLKGDYVSRGWKVTDLLKKIGRLRAESPSFPDVDLGEIVDRLYETTESAE